MSKLVKAISTKPKGLEPSNWVELYADYLFNYAFSRVHRQEVAEDLVQDTFVSAIKAKDSFQHKSAERTWLTSILKNNIIDYYKKKSTQSEISMGKDENEDEKQDYFFEMEGSRKGMWIAESRPNYWNTDFQIPIEKKEFYTILNECLDNLPGKWGAVFTLKNMQDLSASQICKELDISSSNYWVIIHRAKLQLRECMEKNWFNK